MFTPRGPVGSFQHTLWLRRRASEAALLVSCGLSLCLSSGALQHTFHASIIAAKIVSLKFFFEPQYFGLDLRLARTKTPIPMRSIQNADCRPGTKWRLRIYTVFRPIRDDMSSYNLPSVTQSLSRDYLSRLFALMIVEYFLPVSWSQSFLI